MSRRCTAFIAQNEFPTSVLARTRIDVACVTDYRSPQNAMSIFSNFFAIRRDDRDKVVGPGGGNVQLRARLNALARPDP